MAQPEAEELHMTPQIAVDPSLVAKIKKLLNLSRDTHASENEIELARAHAQRLMLEHNITMATAEATDASARSLINRAKTATKGRAMYDWQKNLMYQIANSNFCLIFVQYGLRGRRWMTVGYEIVGREENVTAVTTTFDYLASTIERLARDYGGSQTTVNYTAHSAGGSAADSISLNRQVDTGAQVRRIG
jgi:hypothetical protein